MNQTNETNQSTEGNNNSSSEYTTRSVNEFQRKASQSMFEGLNDFSDALAARDDSFHCDRRTVWGDRISIHLVRTSAGRL